MVIKLDKNKHSETTSLIIQMLGAKTFLHAQKQKGDSPPFCLEGTSNCSLHTLPI